MTIDVGTDNFRKLVGDGSTQTHPISFSFKEHQDIEVRLRTGTTTRDLELGTDYTISGDTLAGQGQLTATTLYQVGEDMLVQRKTGARQTTTLTQKKAFPSQVVEAQMDDMARQIGDGQVEAARSLKYDIEDTYPGDVPLDRADKIMGWDANSQTVLFDRTEFRGPPGTINATGPLAERPNYDNEAEGFSFLATDQDPPLLFFRETATPGVWSPAVPFSFGSGTQNLTRDFGNAVTRVPNNLIDPSIFARGIPAGFPMWWPYAALLPGTLAANGQTIGRVGSGADHESDSYREAYDRIKTWAKSGNTGNEDFDAGNLVKLPDMRGITQGGIDQGALGTPANVLQDAGTIDTTLGSDQAIIKTGALRATLGMYVFSANVPAGTTITAVDLSTNTVTLSQNASATAVDTPASFSWFVDPNGLGERAGDMTWTLQKEELPKITPQVIDPGHNHPGVASMTGGGGRNTEGTLAPLTQTSTGNATTGITIAEFGGDLPHGNLQTTMLGQWVIFMEAVAAAIPTAFGIDGRYYAFDPATQKADPGPGKLRLNAAFASASAMYIDNVDANGHDVGAYIATWANGITHLVNITNPGGFAIYSTAAVQDEGGYKEVGLTHLASSPTFNADDSLAVLHVPAGAAGLFGYRLKFDAADQNTATAPVQGGVKINDLALADFTEIAISDNLDLPGMPSFRSVMATWAGTPGNNKGVIKLSQTESPQNFVEVTVTDVNLNETGFVRLTVPATKNGSNGAFQGNAPLAVTMIRAIAGEDGIPAGINWTFDANQTMADPGAGKFRISANGQQLAISVTSAEGADVTNELDSWDKSTTAEDRGTLSIKRTLSPGVDFRLEVISELGQEQGGPPATWYLFTIANKVTAGSIADASTCTLQFARTGNRGAGPLAFKYNWRQITDPAQLAAGDACADNLDLSAASRIYFHDTDNDGINRRNDLLLWTATNPVGQGNGALFLLQETNQVHAFKLTTNTGQTGYVQIHVETGSHSGPATSIPNNDDIWTGSRVRGDLGDPGTSFTWRGDYAAGTSYNIRDAVAFGGSSYISKQNNNQGNTPPAPPAPATAFWDYLAQKGVDGLGSGDVIGPAGAPDGNFAVFTGGGTGKAIANGGTPGALAFLATVAAAQIDADAVTTAKLLNAAVTFAKMQNGVGMSVLGKKSSPPGTMEDIQATGEGHVLRRLSNTVEFGKLNNTSIDFAATQRLLARNSAGAGQSEEVAIQTVMEWLGSTRGQILARRQTAWTAIAAGAAGTVLMPDANQDPLWQFFEQIAHSWTKPQYRLVNTFTWTSGWDLEDGHSFAANATVTSGNLPTPADAQSALQTGYEIDGTIRVTIGGSSTAGLAAGWKEPTDADQKADLTIAGEHLLFWRAENVGGTRNYWIGSRNDWS